jgi:hypothetical protein
LSLRSEAGKAFISLSVEVEQREASRIYRPARNGPAQQRRRERREHARVEEAAAVREAAEKVSAEVTENAEECTADKHTGADTEEAKAYGGQKQSAVLIEPSDEIDNTSILSEKQQVVELCSMLSVILIRQVNPSNEVIKETIKKKLETKKVKVCDIFIQRSNQGTFMWSDVKIEAFNGKELEETAFEFANCRVLPFYGQRKQ